MYTILVADDEDLERQAIKKIIEKTCPEISTVYEASNGVEAIELYKKNKPDIFFCDIKMPGKTGLEVVREIRESDKDQIIVFLTAYDYFNYAKEAVSLKLNEYILKPVDNSIIQSLITRLIQNLKERNELKEKNEKRLNLLSGFFENEFLAAILNNGNEHDFVEEFKEIFPHDTNICFACCFDLNYSNFPDFEKVDNHLNLLKQKIIQIIKGELDKYRYSHFIHERDNIFFLLMFPDVETFNEDFTSCEKHFESIESILTKKTNVLVRFVLKATENSAQKVREALLEAKEVLQVSKNGVTMCTNASDIQEMMENNQIQDEEYVKLSSRLMKLMQEIGQKIDEEYMSVLTLDEAAASVNLSSFYFSKVFKQYWGRNFVDYLNEVRFKNACILLENPKMHIKDVAVKAGYSDANYFSRVFKSMSGITPSEYRNKNIR